jgi:hypothetical protein
MWTLLVVLALMLAEATNHRTNWITHYVMPPARPRR